MTQHRFKIDLHDSYCSPFALYVRRPCWHWFVTGIRWWKQVDRFETRDAAVAFYEKVKSLPEYLE